MIPIIEPAPLSGNSSSTWTETLGRIGNVGLMLAWEKEGKEGYLGEGMVRRALEGGGGIVNTKILGEDSVRELVPSLFSLVCGLADLNFDLFAFCKRR